MDLFKAAEEDRRGMRSVWLDRLPSVAEFMGLEDKPEQWHSRPVSNLPGGYAQAASVLMDTMISLASQQRGEAAALLPPYLFLRRHQFELQLKSIIRIVAGNAKMTHSLLGLWEQVQPRVKTVLANETHDWPLPSLTLADVSELIRQFHKIDPSGDALRYGRFTKGAFTMLDLNRVDLEHAERNMLAITEFLWWARLEIGVTAINLPYKASAEEVRDHVWRETRNDEG